MNQNENIPNDLSSLKEIVESLWMNEDWSKTNFGLGVSGDALKRVAHEVSLQVGIPTDSVSLAIEEKLRNYTFEK
jgi:hypothetical protein